MANMEREPVVRTIKYSKRFLKKVDKVQAFLDANYPCTCPEDDRDCPKNYYEAVEIVSMLTWKDYR